MKFFEDRPGHGSDKFDAGYVGDFGSFSHIATRQIVNDQNKLVKGFRTFEHILSAIESDMIKIGVIPIENSYAGKVSDVHKLLKKTKLHIIGEKLLKISHAIYIKDDQDPKEIEYIHSHEQALSQCKSYISKNFPNAKLIRESSTSTAGIFVTETLENGHAAICSEMTGNHFKLKLLDTNIQDSNDNATLFCIFSKEKNQIPVGEKNVLTSIIFEVKNKSGGLYNALGCFVKNGINIIKLEHYIPTVIDSESSCFFITAEGNKEDENFKTAIENLKENSVSLHSFGSYFKNRSI